MSETKVDETKPNETKPKKFVRRSVAIGLGVVITIVAIVVILIIGVIPTMNKLSKSNMASTLLNVQMQPLSELYTPSHNVTTWIPPYYNATTWEWYGGYYKVTGFVPAQVVIFGTAWNIGTETAYNCQVHVVGYYEGGVVALDTYINIGLGTQSVIYVNGQMPIDTTINCSDGIVNWITTPICTNTP
ncbi:MAG: hypothetical protein ABSF24_10285 [Candidatus Bathyarchaeia archaeon]